MKDCIDQVNTKAVKQFMDMTNGQTTGMTTNFKVFYVSISLQCLKLSLSSLKFNGLDLKCAHAQTRINIRERERERERESKTFHLTQNN